MAGQEGAEGVENETGQGSWSDAQLLRVSSEVSWGEVLHPTAAQLVAGVQPFLFEEVERVGVSPVRTWEGGAMFVGLAEKVVKIRIKGGIFGVAR